MTDKAWQIAIFFGQGILELVREKSGKSQGILLSLVCGNPDFPMEISVLNFETWQFDGKSAF